MRKHLLFVALLAVLLLTCSGCIETEPSEGMKLQPVRNLSYNGIAISWQDTHNSNQLKYLGGSPEYLVKIDTGDNVYEYTTRNRHYLFFASNVELTSSFTVTVVTKLQGHQDSEPVTAQFEQYTAVYDVCVNELQENYRIFHDPVEAERFLVEVREGNRYKDIIYGNWSEILWCCDTKTNTTFKPFFSIDAFMEYISQLQLWPLENYSDQMHLYDADKQQVILQFNTPTPYTIYGYASFGRLDYFPASFSLEPEWQDCPRVTLHSGEETTTLVIPCRDVLLRDANLPGYVFEGWYADDNFSGQPITKITAEDSYTDLYAKFRKVDSYTMTLEPYGTQTFDAIEYVYGEEIALPSLVKSFHIFKGWCVDAQCQTTPSMTISADFYGSYHLYPCFEGRQYTILLTTGDDTVSGSVPYGQNFQVPVPLAAEGFIGYFDIDGVQYTDEKGNSLAPFTDGADIQLFAKYKEE